MEPSQQTPGSHKSQESAHETERPRTLAALWVRLWEYGGPQRKLRDLVGTADPPVAQLGRSRVHDGQGKVIEAHQNILVAHFEDPYHVLSTAKMLAQKLVTFQRRPPW